MSNQKKIELTDVLIDPADLQIDTSRITVFDRALANEEEDENTVAKSIVDEIIEETESDESAIPR